MLCYGARILHATFCLVTDVVHYCMNAQIKYPIYNYTVFHYFLDDNLYKNFSDYDNYTYYLDYGSQMIIL